MKQTGIAQTNLLTWADTGVETVHSYIGTDPKANFTVLASIDAYGNKLPLFFLAKGVSERCEKSQFKGSTSDHWLSHSKSGWMQNDTFCEYLYYLRSHFSDGEVLHLILDSCPSHKVFNVKEQARALGIVLHFIPPGFTDRLQPLDRRCFGALKASARSRWRKLRLRDETFVPCIESSAQVLIYAWNKLSSNTLEAAWEIYDETLYWDDMNEDEASDNNEEEFLPR